MVGPASSQRQVPSGLPVYPRRSARWLAVRAQDASRFRIRSGAVSTSVVSGRTSSTHIRSCDPGRQVVAHDEQKVSVRDRVPEPTPVHEVLPHVVAQIPPAQPGVGADCGTTANPQDSPIVRLALDIEQDRDPRVRSGVQRFRVIRFTRAPPKALCIDNRSNRPESATWCVPRSTGSESGCHHQCLESV